MSKFEAGDRVRYVSNSTYSSAPIYVYIGSIYTVMQTRGCDTGGQSLLIKAGKSGYRWYDASRFELETSTVFEPGDLVERINSHASWGSKRLRIGDIATVDFVDAHGRVHLKEFPEMSNDPRDLSLLLPVKNKSQQKDEIDELIEIANKGVEAAAKLMADYPEHYQVNEHGKSVRVKLEDRKLDDDLVANIVRIVETEIKKLKEEIARDKGRE
jgi:hypothetical protein